MRRTLPIGLLALAACGDAAPRAPSVVLVSIDTLRADHLGLYGYGRDTSPFLDRFARDCTVFENAFTPAAWTLVAHMTMLTGLYPKQHGVVEGDLGLAAEAPLLAERLQRAGYQTLGLYRPGWVHARHGFARGFDVFRGHQGAEEAETHLAEELARLDPTRPAFLFLHLFDVHNDPSTKVPPTVFSAPAPYQDLFLDGAHARLEGETYLSLKRKPRLEEDERAALVALYDDGIRHVDAVLERVFAHLAADPCFARALVIVTADHGESLAQRGKLTGHGGPWQEGLHVPLLVRRPDGRGAGERVKESAHLVDVVQTVLDFTGLGPDPLLSGVSLLGPLPAQRLLTGGDDPVEFLVQWPEKLTRVGQHFGAVDLASDPLELAPRTIPPQEFEALRARLTLPAQSFFPPRASAEMSAADRAELDALGYGGGEREE